MLGIGSWLCSLVLFGEKKRKGGGLVAVDKWGVEREEEGGEGGGGV